MPYWICFFFSGYSMWFNEKHLIWMKIIKNFEVLHLFFIFNLKSRSLLLFYFEVFNLTCVYKALAIYLVLSIVRSSQRHSKLGLCLRIYSKVRRQDTYVKRSKDYHCTVVLTHNIVTFILQVVNMNQHSLEIC